MPQMDEFEVLSFSRLNHVTMSVTQIGYRNPHIHQALEICLVLAGEADVWARDRVFHTGEGAILLFSPGEPHEISSTDPQGVRIAYIQIASHFCRDYIRPLRNLELAGNSAAEFLTAGQQAALTQQILRTMHDYFTPDSADRLQVLCDVCTLLQQLLSLVPYHYLNETAYQAHGKKMARIQRITEYMDTHCTERLTLEELAEQENITTTYLSHFIRDNLNMTFQQYLNNLRFEKARKLIETTDMCLSDVSLASGFSDPKYMKRMFAERFGCTPGAHRQNAIQSLPLHAQNVPSQQAADAEACLQHIAAFAALHFPDAMGVES